MYLYTIIMRLKKEVLSGSGCASSPGILIDDNLRSCGKCQFCLLHLNSSTSFKSTVTNDSFSLTKSSHDIEIACKTKNVVYLITCAKCGIQYVGMTTQTINSRFDGHRTKIRNKKVSTVLCQHFWKEDHSLSDIDVQIIYHFRGKDEDAKDVLLHVEDFYMKKLVTVMPFGLNDHITDLNINLSSYDYRLFNRANTPFFPYPHSRKKRSHGHRKNSKFKITSY